MTRAPKFVVLTADGLHCGSYATEQEARNRMLTSDCTIHPIGAALPAVPAEKSLGGVLWGAYSPGSPWTSLASSTRDAYEHAASAVIAAHEAGREMERVVRWAVRLAPGWFGSNFCNANKSERTLFNLREHAEVIAQSFTGARIVPVPTRRRRVVKS